MKPTAESFLSPDAGTESDAPYVPLKFPKDGIGDILRLGDDATADAYFPEPSYDIASNSKSSPSLCTESDESLCRGKTGSGRPKETLGSLPSSTSFEGDPRAPYKQSSRKKRSAQVMSDQVSTNLKPTRPPPEVASQTSRPVYKMPPAFTHNGEVPDRARQRELEEFYKNYNAMEGLVTAIVLGGFFVFVSLLVLYKTKCKPMWKNRGKRLTNTPATHSMGENETSACQPGPAPTCTVNGVNGEILEGDLGMEGGSDGGGGGGGDDDDLEMEDAFDEDDFEFECIPLKSVYTMSGEDEDEEDVYFLDEFGNYVFPVSSTTGTLGGTGSVSMRTAAGGGGGGGGGCGSCSCGPQAGDELDIATSIRRRQSQVITSYSYSTHGRQQMFTGPGSDFLEKIFRQKDVSAL